MKSWKDYKIKEFLKLGHQRVNNLQIKFKHLNLCFFTGRSQV